MYNNGEIYARVVDSTKQTGNNSETGYATAKVSNIDKIEPNSATIKLSNTRVELGNTTALEEQSIDYTETLETFDNPERGFYRTAGLRLAVSGNKATNPTAKLTHLRVGIGKFSGAFNGNQDLEFTQDALNALNETLANARKNGCSIIIRFAYDNYEGRGNLEPSMDMILKHISQLKPVFQANQDVISCIELGLFGPWGEMHTSSMCTTDNVNRAIDAMLNSAPEKIKISVRTPNYYAKWLGIDRADLDKHVAQKGTREYRVGIFNDGYLGSGNDLGTYANREKEITWLEKQAMHTLYGGEVVANANPSNVPAINTAAYMSQEAFRTHTTYLNAEWNNTVINSWKNETYNGDDNIYAGQTGYTYIANHLGYRFVLRKSEMPKSIIQNQRFKLNLNIENVGFANLVNDKVVSLVFVKDDEKYEIKTNLDATQWNSTEIAKINFATQLPKNITPGEWKVYLRISNEGSIDTDNNYQCIRLANKGTMWNQTLGANYIGKFTVTEEHESENITANVTQNDSQSGVDITKCKWVYTTDRGEIGTNESEYTGGTFNANPENLTLENTKAGTYYLHVLTVDKAGNKKETISDPVTVVEISDES